MSGEESRRVARLQARRHGRELTLATLSLILRLMLGGILIYAAVPKLVHPDQFADIVANYRILPDALVPWLALTLPWLELLVGVFLILGVVTRVAAILALAMFAVFAAALVSAEARHLDIACGCFNVAVDSGKTSESLWLSLPLVLAGVALLILADDGERFSLARLLRWSTSGRRRVLAAVLIALAVVLADAVVVAAMRPDDGSAARAGPLSFLARRELSSEQLLAPLARAQPDLRLDVTQVIAARDVPDKLRGGAMPDLVEVELDQLPWLVARGYLQPIDTSRVAAWDRLSDTFRSFPGLTVDGKTYAAPVDASLTGIVYRPDTFPTAPSSYRALFEHRFKNKAGLENDATVAVRLGAAVNGWGDVAGLSASQSATVFDFLRTDRPHFYTYYQDQSELQQLFANGRLVVSTGTEATARRSTGDGVPLEFIAPKDGLLVRARGLAIGAQCQNLDAAYRLLDYYLSPSVQRLDAEGFGTVPARSDLAGLPSLGGASGTVASAPLVLVTPPTDPPTWEKLWQEVAVTPGGG